MRKECALSAIIILVIASGAWAAIGQAQGFEIGAVNAMWGAGIGSAEGGHQVMIGQEQKTATAHFSTAGLQKETGVFVQTASASGPAANSARQTAGIEGRQQQFGSPWAPTVSAQGQRMGVAFTTQVSVPSGAGAASGMQSFVGGQTHTLLTPTTLSTESQVVGATQYAAVVGGPQADPTVENSLSVDLHQGQLTGVPGWHP